MKPRTKASQPETIARSSDERPLIVRFLDFIAERKLEPGERLPSERVLAERFGVTRAMLREALTVLQAMRVLESRPRSGIYLRAEARVGSLDAAVMKTNLGLPLKPAEADELNEFRSILECQAIALACERRTAEDIARLDACMDICREGLRRGESIAQPSADFHLAIVAATHNQFLLRAANSCYLATRELRDQLFSSAEVSQDSILEHQQIRDAIAQGCVASARKAMKSHLETAAQYWRRQAQPATTSAANPATPRRHRGPMTAQ
jgi:GntR family transcriptional repressor for pyruvate dehydrogenase complex